MQRKVTPLPPVTEARRTLYTGVGSPPVGPSPIASVPPDMPRLALRSETQRHALWVGVLAALAAAAMLLPAPDATRGLAGYVPLHTALEVVAIAIAAMIFGISWTTRKFQHSGRALVLGLTFLGVALLDLCHLLSYQGMPDFLSPSGPEKAITFWLAARTVAVLGMLTVAFWPRRWNAKLDQQSAGVWLAATLGLVAALVLWILVFPDTLPATFAAETGLTTFKLQVEYGLSAGYLIAALGAGLRLQRERQFHAGSLAAAALIMAMSEFFFTLYANVTDIYNLLGHVYKILAYGFLYRAVFAQTVQVPYAQLAQSEAQLRTEAALNAGVLALEQHADQWTEADLLAAGARLAGDLTQSPHVQLFWRQGQPATLRAASPDATVPHGAVGRWATEPQVDAPFQATAPSADDLSGLNPARQPWQRVLSVVSQPDQGRQLLLVVLDATHDSTQHAQALHVLVNELVALVRRQQQDRTIQRLSKALEQSPNPVMITNAARHVEYVNQAFTQLSGYQPDEILGRDPALLKSGLTPPQTYASLWRQLQAGQTWQGELINRRKDGSLYTERALIYPIHDQAGRLTDYVSHKEDISERKATEERIRQLSQYDQLTGVLNRATFELRLAESLHESATSGEPLALLWINLDNFKAVNDSLGHTRGDEVLLHVANMLRHTLARHDVLGRHAGDNFLALVSGRDQSSVALLARDVLDCLQQPLAMGGLQVSISGSVGIALYPNDATTADDLAKAAEVAMYRVKDEGRNAMRFYAPDMQKHTERTLQIASALKMAAARGELSLVYQPQLDLTHDRLAGAEALLRWRHPELGQVAPGEFIPIAEQNGLMVSLGWWVIDSVLRQMQAWQAAGLPVLTIAINVSALQFAQPDLVARLQQMARSYGVAPQHLEIELTEAVALRDPAAAGDTMRALAQSGFRVAIDDFGTGYSSMSYLKRFAVHRLKIDQSFVADLSTQHDDKAIVLAIVQMAASLGMESLAEGVETPEQLAVLRAMGCDAIQGYWYGRPQTVGEFTEFVHRNAAPIVTTTSAQAATVALA